MADTARTRPGNAGGITSADYWQARWAIARADAAADTDLAINGPEGHIASEWHSGRFRFVTIGCDMGVPGTPLTQTGIWGHRVIDFPLEVTTATLLVSPVVATAVVDVLKAADLAAFHAGTYSSVCGGNRPSLTARRAPEEPLKALELWPVTKWAPGEVLVWQLVSISGSAEVLTAQVGMRRI
jgi:hypothetical protein